MTGYWIKLYIEVIDDPKMALLPDRLWRRAVELFLLAGKNGQDGTLPSVRNMAWMLRMKEDELRDDLIQLARVGIVCETLPDDWFVVNFSKRQASRTDAERKASQREREKSRQYHGDGHDNGAGASQPVTQINRLTERDTETDTEREGRAFPDADAGEWKAGPPPPPAPADPENFEGMSVRQAETIKEIQLVVKATGWMPGKPVWRMVVETIRGYKLSEATVRECYTAWCARGFKRENIAWLTEWAVDGIPPARGNEKRSGNSTSPDAILAALDQAARMAQ